MLHTVALGPKYTKGSNESNYFFIACLLKTFTIPMPRTYLTEGVYTYVTGSNDYAGSICSGRS